MLGLYKSLWGFPHNVCDSIGLLGMEAQTYGVWLQELSLNSGQGAQE